MNDSLNLQEHERKWVPRSRGWWRSSQTWHCILMPSLAWASRTLMSLRYVTFLFLKYTSYICTRGPWTATPAQIKIEEIGKLPTFRYFENIYFLHLSKVVTAIFTHSLDWVTYLLHTIVECKNIFSQSATMHSDLGHILINTKLWRIKIH